MNSIIRAIPTLFLFKDGKVVDRVVGLRGKKDLKATLDKVVRIEAATDAGHDRLSMI